MKRNSIRFTVLAFVLVLAFSLSFTGCSRGDLPGTWKATSYKINDEVQSFEEAGMSAVDMTITLSDDGKAVVVTNEHEEEGTWGKDDDANIQINLPDRTETLIREDGKLLIGSDTAGYIVFEKED